MERIRFECATTSFVEISQLCQFFKEYFLRKEFLELNKDGQLNNLSVVAIEQLVDTKFSSYPDDLIVFYFKPLSSKTLMLFESNIPLTEFNTLFNNNIFYAREFPLSSELMSAYSLLNEVRISRNSNENQEKKHEWDEFYHIYATQYVYQERWDKNFKFVVINKDNLKNGLVKIRDEKLYTSKTF